MVNDLQIYQGVFETLRSHIQPDPSSVVVKRIGTNYRISWNRAFENVRIFVAESPDAPRGDWKRVAHIRAEDNFRVLVTSAGEARPFFKVVYDVGETCDREWIATERVLSLSGGYNFRDLGGYHTAAGKQVKWGRIYRSANLAQLTDLDMKYLQTLGIRTVIDLRSEVERTREPDCIPDKIRYLPMPLRAVDGVGVSLDYYLQDLTAVEERLTDSYISHFAEGNAIVYGQVLSHLADEERLPALIHCTAGKDRTGFAAALLLQTLGVDEAAVLADYTLSNLSAEQFWGRMRPYLEAAGLQNTTLRDVLPLLAARPDMIQIIMLHIVENYGSLRRYLEQRAGVPAVTFTNLKAALL